MSDASFRISRRGFLNLTALGAASAISACSTTGPRPAAVQPPPPASVEPPLGDYAT
ncbi:MAG: L,D-transpeptidase, partial [Mesorhizobium sp.]